MWRLWRQITLKRTWGNLSVWEKLKLLYFVLMDTSLDIKVRTYLPRLFQEGRVGDLKKCGWNVRADACVMPHRRRTSNA